MQETGESGEARREAERLMRVLGDQLRRLRLAGNRSQEEVAAASGIGMSTLKRLESGRGCHLSALAEVLLQLDVAEPLEEFIEEFVQSAQADDAARRRATGSRKQPPA
ncbi:XRE family transcriptional regulator [Microbulbifer flavimaris]|uniref:XRE family transcriptional regulator n=1 Tax=Microbulbifer flavimaris TaxID=1781068 RepID=A0ABX4I415_9GAMM|nr:MULTISPECIES: helix-turn-helix transcriptional regulator [Microbulbifer]KUJ84552.1 hypothetical protein AVO43_02475 [Microbulbifer sp. ZGT114]PCO06640.1 XRE family transcriptional regulator [Microbulbifer flavimaris]